MADKDDELPGHRPMTPLLAALWAAALWMLENLSVGVTEEVRRGAFSDIVTRGACTALATSLVVFLMVRVHAREVSLRATVGVVPVAPLHALLAVAAGAGMYPLMSTIDGLAQKRWPSPEDTSEVLQKLLSVPTLGARIAFVVSAFVVIPLAHELFFRGILYGELRRATNVRTATIASAVFYAASQLDWRSLPTTLALGFALARLRERSGSVAAPVVAHIAYWAVVGVPILRGADPMADVTYPTRWIIGGVVIAVLALVAVGAGSRREE
jgi:membrane protease YdiL (CAAX protease family)